MKKLFFVLLAIVFLFGCGTLQLKDDAIGNSTGYFAGKGMGIAVNEKAPKSVPALEKNYDEFMARTALMEMVPTEESMKLYTSSILILSLETEDPYGFISDLTFLLSQFGGKLELSPVPGVDPVLTGLQPIPRAVFQSFEFGYDSGKRISQAK